MMKPHHNQGIIYLAALFLFYFLSLPKFVGCCCDNTWVHSFPTKLEQTKTHNPLKHTPIHSLIGKSCTFSQPFSQLHLSQGYQIILTKWQIT